MEKKYIKSYVSLFSSSGVGDYGFYQSGFSLVASNELLERRMQVQKSNFIAKDKTAYITGDIQEVDIKNKLYSKVSQWLSSHNQESLDLLVATPPCQGISVANHYKKDSDLSRNSLVLQSIIVSENTKPKVIVFENIKRFLQTACTDVDGETYDVETVIHKHLESDYHIVGKEINFKDYGANSSRPRTLVIAVRKDIFPNVNPSDLFPDRQEAHSLREIIGQLEPLKNMGEISNSDILHQFKPYRSDMRDWIKGLHPGENAFDNTDPLKRPHHIVEGTLVPNANKNGDKYKRQVWDKVAPAVHTRNDILASQNTVHPSDDRVFSIRELMIMMNVPKEFKWSDESYDFLNNLTNAEKIAWLKKNEINIRQSLGEAVPPIIFEQVGKKAGELIDRLYKN